MKLDSNKAGLNKNQADCFDFLSKPENYEKIMPENTVKFELKEENGFLFQLKGMPEIALKLKSADANDKVVWEAGGGKIDFNLTVNIQSSDAQKSEVQFLFDGELSSMLAMMVKKPLKNFINTLSANLGTCDF